MDSQYNIPLDVFLVGQVIYFVVLQECVDCETLRLNVACTVNNTLLMKEEISKYSLQ